MVICLERGADLHMARLMPLPLTVSCSWKSRFILLLSFWYRLIPVVLDKIQRAVKWLYSCSSSMLNIIALPSDQRKLGERLWKKTVKHVD